VAGFGWTQKSSDDIRDAGVRFGLGSGPEPHRTAPQVRSGSGSGSEDFRGVRFGVHQLPCTSCTESEPDCTPNLISQISSQISIMNFFRLTIHPPATIRQPYESERRMIQISTLSFLLSLSTFHSLVMPSNHCSASTTNSQALPV